jgi:hypothetical protein
MSNHPALFVLFVCCGFIQSQNLKGKVYDATSTIEGVTVLNKSQNSIKITDARGTFTIPAEIGDTLEIKSLFHYPKIKVLMASDFKDIAVIELQNIVNTLDEVQIKSEPTQPEFNGETYSAELKHLIREDIKRNPGLYQPQGAQYGVDFIYLIGQLAKLFKSKRPKWPKSKPITYRQFDSLFSHSSFFNTDLLTASLKIPEDKRQLFLDFCAAKQPNGELLKDEKKMALLEFLVLNSQLFLILLEAHGQTSEKQD